MKRPDIGDIDKKLLKYIEYLESELDKINRDGVAAVYVSVNKKFIELGEQINKLNINIESDKDDKVFDRFLKFSTESKKIAENLDFLKGRSTPADIDKEQLRADASAEKHIFEDV